MMQKEPVGYVIKNGIKKIVHLTDTGYIDQGYHELLENADLYVLESNHNPCKTYGIAKTFSSKKTNFK